jgi:glyoxylase I family protein
MPHIEHFAIFARDLEASRSFYETAFGLRVIVDNTKAPIRGYFLSDDRGCVLEIIERPASIPAADTRHVCHTAFLVEDYEQSRRELEARGVRFEPDTEVINENVRTAFFGDPDGNRCQIVWRSRPLGS